MVEYLYLFAIIFSLVLTGIVLFINASNPALLPSLELLVRTCTGISGVAMWFFIVGGLQDVIRLLRNRQFLKNLNYGCISLLILMALPALPVLVLEKVVPGHYWLGWMLISGAVWRVVFGVVIRLHIRLRAFLLVKLP